MSASLVRTSIILPLPSSPHWAPTRIVLAISYSRCGNKNPRSANSGACALFCAQTVRRAQPCVNFRRLGKVAVGGFIGWLQTGQAGRMLLENVPQRFDSFAVG